MKKIGFITFILLIIFNSAFGEIFEAENATLVGGAVKSELAGASEGFIVEMRDGHLNFDISIENEGFYNIYIYAAAPGGKKTNNFFLNGGTIEFTLHQNSNYEIIKLVSNIKLSEGEHDVKITNSWGWINIDYIWFEQTNASERFDLNQTLVTPDPIENAQKLYQFLLDNYGKKVISGAMTLNSMDEINWLNLKTGKKPALLGLDFMHCGRNYSWYNDEEPVNDAKNYYNQNGIPAFCWHWRDPSKNTEAFYTKDTDFDISKISDEESPEYKAMLDDIDYISGLIKKLQDNNVPILWRPLHEASGGWFWWGAKGAESCKKLYRLMYDRMVNHHGLKNLIWVWTSQQNDSEWYPGDDVVDILGRDIYKEGDHSSQILEFVKLNDDMEGKKMVTLSECGSIPDPDELMKDGAAWSYFMPWYGDFVRDNKHNSLDLWEKLFNHEYVITLDEMPDLKSYTKTVQTWRSALYPENWKPGFKDNKDRFFHDFSYAGYHQGEKELPFINTNVADVTKDPYNADNSGNTDVTAIIQQALDDVGQAGGGVVYLPPGKYRVNPGTTEHALRIRYNNTVLRGAGTDSTFIYNSTSNMRQKNIIYVMGDWATWSNEYGTVSKITTDLLYPTQVIPVESVDGFETGDQIIIRSNGTEAFAEEHKMGGIWEPWASRVMFHRTIDSINAESNLIYIDSPTRYFMKKRDNARVYHAKQHITECGIESLSIGNRQSTKTGWGEETYHDSGTGAYEVHASHAIYLKYAYNCWVKNVNTYKPEENTDDFHLLSNCLLINQSRGVTVDSCFFQKPQYEGGGGNGYMFTLSANDCLIKNSRANHSRHNYDFKYPYSNGNVIHKCIAENSKYSSDFHMYLSMANLFDVTTVDKDYLESMFRPWGGDVIHGYSSTQSVFYNTKGIAYHPNRNYLIDSRQFGHGYVIGTSGNAHYIKLTPVSGTTNGYEFDTSPIDFSEGIGEGESLEPQSLYLDQLERRLMDTSGIPTFKVSVIVKHNFTNEFLAGAEIEISGKKDSTNESGFSQIEGITNLFNLSISKNNYYPVLNEQFVIYSDTTLYFNLTPKEYNIKIVVHDEENGDTFEGVPVQFNNTEEVTNASGEVYFLAYEGIFNYFIEKNSYFNESGSVKIESDTTLHFYLTRSSATIKFRLKEGTAPVNEATVILNDDTLITTSLGLATFRDLAVSENYNYLIYKGGYNDLAGSIYLDTDTTINLQLEQYPSATIDHKNSELKIWPNPVEDYLNVKHTGSSEISLLKILNLYGNSIKTITMENSFNKRINLQELTPGLYLLQYFSERETYYQSFIKK